MTKIWKYQLKNSPIQAIELPVNSKILTIQVQKGTSCVWVELDDAELKRLQWNFYRIELEIAKYQISSNA